MVAYSKNSLVLNVQLFLAHIVSTQVPKSVRPSTNELVANGRRPFFMFVVFFGHFGVLKEP